MLHRIRLAMQSRSFAKFKGTVEADETFIGGKAIFMHYAKKKEKIRGRGQYASGKVAVMGLLERHGLDRGSKGASERDSEYPEAAYARIHSGAG